MSPHYAPRSGGDDGIRTHDPLLAGQVLSQLSYTPILGSALTLAPSSARVDVGPGLLSRAVSGKVSSALHSLTSVFGMGTGGPCAFEGPTSFRFILFSLSLKRFAESLKTEQRVLFVFLYSLKL